MPGHEPIDGDTSGDPARLEMPPPPATVAATHLAASAMSLAEAMRPGSAGVEDLGELAEVLDALRTTQRGLTDILGNIAGLVDATPVGAADPEDVTALVEVLLAASTAAEHTSGALGHAAPIVATLLRSTRP